MKVWTFNFHRWRKKLPLIFASLVIISVIGLAIYRLPNSTSTTTSTKTVEPQQTAYYQVRTKEKVAAITFDWSYGTKVAVPILNTLKEKNVKSTFFLSGPAAKKYPEIPKLIVAGGHEVASHGHEHVDLDKLPQNKIKENILNAQKNIKEETGKEPHFIRCPNGAWKGNNLLEVANSCGYTVIQWGTDSLDWFKDRTANQIAERVIQNIHPGDIVLMHASDVCDRTPEALPIILSALEKKGYKLVTLSELFKYGPGIAN